MSTPLPQGATPPVEVTRVKPSPGPRTPYSTAQACLEVRVQADGSVTFVRTISATNADFADQFRQAIVQWRYQPATLDGKPIPVTIAVYASYDRR